jgi:predicted nucleotide-binding protein
LRATGQQENKTVKANVLLITDTHEHSWVQTVRQAIEPLGDLVIENADPAGVQALQLRHDLIIVDARYVEDVTGMLSLIRAKRTDAKIVVATASPSWRRARAALLAGATDYISRTINAADLRSRFESILAWSLPSSDIIDLPEEPTVFKATIFFADNDPEFLEARKIILEQEGYRVIATSNLEEARRLFEGANPDLAILDVRMMNDDDGNDRSGILFATEIGRSAPKIMLTGYPSKKNVLESLKPEIRDKFSIVNFVAKNDGAATLLRAVQKELNRRVFIVHGRDDEARETVSRYIERLNLNAVILRDQPGAGSTIIEKFDNYADVNFAVVLLTPDDVGGARGLRDRPEELKLRASQNAVFELGYFIGRFGRRKVGALYKEGVELPSDYQGVQYISLDSGGAWKLELAQNMKQAGLDVDLNMAV